jgi:putative ABC transport system permease protein
MPTVLLIAWRNLFQARRRSLLLGLAIGMVTLLLVLLMALSAGINDSLVRSATTISAGHVNVAGFFKPTTGSAAPMITGRKELRALVEQNTPEIEYVIERDRGWGKVVSETGSVQVGGSEQRVIDTVQLARESEYQEGGRDEVLGDVRRLGEPGTMLIFVSQAKKLGVTVGDQVTIKTETAAGMTNTADATVIGVARDFGMLSSWAVFVPRQLVLDLYQLNDDRS